MYTRKLRNNLKILFLNLFKNNNYVDFDVWTKLLNITCQKNLKYIFDYYSLDYPFLNDFIEFLNLKYEKYIFKCLNWNQYTKLIKTNKVFKTLHVKIDTDLAYHIVKRNITDTTKFFNYILDTYEDHVWDLVFNIHIDKNQIHIAYETIKLLTDKNIPCNIIFDECIHGTRYDFDISCPESFVVKDDINCRLILDRILFDNNLLILNKDRINEFYNVSYKNKCNVNLDCKFLCVDYDFNVRLCNRIKTEEKLNPLDCLDEDCNLKDFFLQIIKKQYNTYCNGCMCPFMDT